MEEYTLLFSVKCDKPFTSHIIGSFMIESDNSEQSRKTAEEIIDNIRDGRDIEHLVSCVRQDNEDNDRCLSDLRRFVGFYNVPLDDIVWDSWCGPWRTPETRYVNWSKDSKQYEVKETDWWFSIFLSLDW